MRKLLLLAALVAAPGVASAQYRPYQPYTPPPAYRPLPQPRTNFDYQSGNMTTTIPQYGGGATIYGNNVNTGSTWNTQVQPNGDAHGTDSRGNLWTYNRSTGSYMNSDGTTCFGTGALRTCN